MIDRRRFVAASLAGLAAPWPRVGEARAAPAGRWDAGAVDLVATLDQPGWPQGIAFTPDGRTLVAAGFAEGGIAPSWITTWEVETGRRLKHFTIPDLRIDGVAATPDGRAVVAAGRDYSQLIVCSLETGEVRPLHRRDDTAGIQATPCFSPDGKSMVSAGPDEATIWSTATWTPVQTFPWAGGFRVVIDPSRPWEQMGGQAFALSGEGSLYRLHAVAGKLRSVVVPPGTCYAGPPERGWERVRGVERPWGSGSLILRPDGRMAAFTAVLGDGDPTPAGRPAGEIRTFSIDEDGRWARRATIDPGPDFGGIGSLAFSPDGRALLAGGGWADSGIRRWSVATGRPLSGLAGHSNSVPGLAATGAGWLASAGNADATVRLWRPRSAG